MLLLQLQQRPQDHAYLADLLAVSDGVSKNSPAVLPGLYQLLGGQHRFPALNLRRVLCVSSGLVKRVKLPSFADPARSLSPLVKSSQEKIQPQNLVRVLAWF